MSHYFGFCVNCWRVQVARYYISLRSTAYGRASTLNRARRGTSFHRLIVHSSSSSSSDGDASLQRRGRRKKARPAGVGLTR
ncbi:Hypothetical predicted protein [Cloeon dipterum]|uniref:Uncharacterized protein n=1 Tax=Cloeon dipterum TaxID=197152 RepID=A0A8S1E3U1_9INSE|nr:Hypothetical predicted protein [Cloeon dipterum]